MTQVRNRRFATRKLCLYIIVSSTSSQVRVSWWSAVVEADYITFRSGFQSGQRSHSTWTGGQIDPAIYFSWKSLPMFLWMVRHFRVLFVICIHLFAIVHLTGVLSGRNSVFALLIVILSQICIHMHVLYFIMDFEYIHYEVQNTDATQKLPIPPRIPSRWWICSSERITRFLTCYLFSQPCQEKSISLAEAGHPTYLLMSDKH